MPDLGSSLLALARHAITSRFVESGLLAHQPGLPAGTVDLPELHKMGATFVTLSQRGQLRGCIGSLEAWRPLGQDVRENALAAAFRDPRFDALGEEELPFTRVEVSLLTPAEPMTFTDEADALAQLRPGIDGVIFSVGNRRSTFLPQVWEQLPTPALFMAHLKQKAGLPADYWNAGVQLERYTVKKWQEAQP